MSEELKVTVKQMEQFRKLAAGSFTTFTALTPERTAPVIPVTDADKKFVKDAYEATKDVLGTWLLISVPGEIPIPIADQLLSDRIDVLRAACEQTGYALRVSKDSPSSHAKRFRVNLFTPRGKKSATPAVATA